MQYRLFQTHGNTCIAERSLESSRVELRLNSSQVLNYLLVVWSKRSKMVGLPLESKGRKLI